MGVTPWSRISRQCCGAVVVLRRSSVCAAEEGTGARKAECPKIWSIGGARTGAAVRPGDRVVAMTPAAAEDPAPRPDARGGTATARSDAPPPPSRPSRGRRRRDPPRTHGGATGDLDSKKGNSTALGGGKGTDGACVRLRKEEAERSPVADDPRRPYSPRPATWAPRRGRHTRGPGVDWLVWCSPRDHEEQMSRPYTPPATEDDDSLGERESASVAAGPRPAGPDQVPETLKGGRRRPREGPSEVCPPKDSGVQPVSSAGAHRRE